MIELDETAHYESESLLFAKACNYAYGWEGPIAFMHYLIVIQLNQVLDNQKN